MRYIFLTNTIGGVNGGSCYIRNKLRYLLTNGWEVDIFDNTGQIFEEVQLKELLPYSKNRIPELYYSPNSFSNRRKQKVIKRITASVCEKDRVVVESNLVNLALWGEEVAQYIKAKHLVFLIQENLEITNEKEYDFLKYKRVRNELFSINAIAYNKLFRHFETINDGQNHYWSAGNKSEICDMSCPELIGFHKADYNIGHFGRVKDYFPSMFQEIAVFANRHNENQVNFMLLGVGALDDSLIKVLPGNVNVRVIKSQQPVPKIFFDLSDVIIATSGCASMSFRHGAKVISMEVETNMPLGVMGYDTTDRAYRSSNNSFHETLADLLDKFYTNERYKGELLLDFPTSKYGYDYQLTCSEPNDMCYFDISSVKPSRTISTFVTDLLLRLGLVGFRTQIRYRAFYVLLGYDKNPKSFWRKIMALKGVTNKNN